MTQSLALPPHLSMDPRDFRSTGGSQSVQPGQEYNQQSFDTHAWVLKDQQTNEIVASIILTTQADQYLEANEHIKLYCPDGIRSLRYDTSISLTMQNLTPRNLRVLWINYEGGLTEYGTMAPNGGQFSISSFQTHPWVLQDTATQENVYINICTADSQQNWQIFDDGTTVGNGCQQAVVEPEPVVAIEPEPVIVEEPVLVGGDSPCEAGCVVFYSECDYQGEHLCLCQNDEYSDFTDSEYRDFTAQSLRVPEGETAQLFAGHDYQGQILYQFSSDEPCLEEPITFN